MKRLVLIFSFLAFSVSAFALSFPTLSGRVVDAAHMLSPSGIELLETASADLETKTTDQLVVATVPSLEGGTIEDYGYQLGRAWGIGQKGKDNGVILLVAPKERKVRIEVGYGLEGVLTDAQSEQIIQTIILPEFRAGQMEPGVIAGTRAIISTLGGVSVAGDGEIAASSYVSQKTSGFLTIFNILFILAFIILRLWLLPWWFPMSFPLGRGGFGSGGGGFSGGGGSFGGGGASGGW